MKFTMLWRLLVVPALALAVLSCGKKDQSTLLTYIPADSAYVFAAVEAPSKELADAWLKRLQPLWPIYDTVLERLVEDISYDASEMNGQTVTIDAEYVSKHLDVLVADEDLSRFIL